MWLSELRSLADFSLPRYYGSTNLAKETSIELHVFADEPQLTYGVACYLHYTLSERGANVAFVFGKAWLAPLKQLAIPRLELRAAFLGAKVAETLE